MDALKLRAAVAELPNDVGLSLAAHHLLAWAARAELMLDGVIAARLGRSVNEVLILQNKAIAQMSINAKIALLQELMEAEGWDDDFPFILPVLRAVFALRNKLAHALSFGLADDPNGAIASLWSVRRGNVKIEEVAVATIVGLCHSAQHVTQVDMSFLHVRALPFPYWSEE